MKIKKNCPECAGFSLSHNKEKGEVVCNNCGLVIEDKLFDFGQEWKEHDAEAAAKKRRTGAPLSYTHADKGLGTEIGTKADLYQLNKSNKDKFFRLRKWQNNVASAIERNLQIALSEIQRLVSVLQLSKTIEEEASRIYTMAAQKGIVKGRSTETIVAAVIYIVCRNYEIPKTLDDIEVATNIDKKEIGRNYRYVVREMNLRVTQSDPVNYISRYVSNLDLSQKTHTTAIKLLEKAQRLEITSGKNPLGLAAAAIYAASKLNEEKRTQNEIASAVGVTEVTLRNRYKDFVDSLKLRVAA
ncbi:transcription initiation factor IIB family protein [Bacteroidota bacterium]